MKSISVILFGCAFVLAGLVSPAAATDGYTATGGIDGHFSGFTLGLGFTSSNFIQITALGVYDNGGDGLSTARTVGLWRDSDQMLLASITVPAGTLGTLSGNFRYLTLTSPVTLAPGVNYVIGVEYPTGAGDGDEIYNPTQTPAAGITLSGSTRYIMSASALTYPAYSEPSLQGNVNFQFNVVPEPSTWALLGVGVAGLGVVTLRRRVARA